MNRQRLRRVKSNIMVGVMAAAVILAMLPLIFILLNLILKGASSLNWDFFTKVPAPAGLVGRSLLGGK